MPAAAKAFGLANAESGGPWSDACPRMRGLASMVPTDSSPSIRGIGVFSRAEDDSDFL